MKSKQWVAAVVLLAGVVFAIAFAVNYIGPTPTDSGTTPDGGTTATLSFFSRKFPPPWKGPQMEWELKKPGHHDFWFQNQNPHALTVGLDRKGCKCSSVQLFLSSPEWDRRQVEVLVPLVAGALQASRTVGGPIDLGGLATLAMVAGSDRALRDLEAKLPRTGLEKETTASVPPGASGWVRLLWSGEKTDTEQVLMNAKLWFEHGGKSVDEMLEVRLGLLAPVMVETREKYAGTLAPRDLPHELSIRCWSSTRSKFRIQARSVEAPVKEGADPLAVGQPVPLTAEELRQLQREFNGGPVVLAGYRLPVTLQAKAKDGTPFDVGPFRRLVQLTSEDPGIDPVLLAVSGAIESAVAVGSGEDAGRVLFGPFDASKGASRSVRLRSDVKGLRLELDRTRIPSFLKASLEDEPEVSKEGRRAWRLDVQVLPDAVDGPFPNDHNPALRDDALYVKVLGESSRYIRIPVLGSATTR